MGKDSFQMTILGCGTSSGVPLIHCNCRVCKSREPKNQRLRASAWVTFRGKQFLIDTSTDLRQQALRAKIPRVDAVLYTHPHADHIHGIDEMRAFNFSQKEAIPVYGNAWTVDELGGKFPYIFSPIPESERLGGGIPQLTLNRFEAKEESLSILGCPIVPIPLLHGKQECVGFRFDHVAYVTDCSSIPAASLDRMRDLEVLVLDCLRVDPHGTHFNLDQALAVVADLKPKKVFFTHLSHDFDYRYWGKSDRAFPDWAKNQLASSKNGGKIARKIPKNVKLAYDGLRITV